MKNGAYGDRAIKNTRYGSPQRGRRARAPCSALLWAQRASSPDAEDKLRRAGAAHGDEGD